MWCNFLNRFFGIALFLCIFPFTSIAVAVENSGTVVLLPLSVEKAGKYQVLKDGVRSMLIGRLTAKKGISVVEKSLSQKEQSRFVTQYPKKISPIFNKLATDYIGIGSISSNADGLVLEIDFFSKEGSTPINVSVRAEDDKQIIGAIDLLSDKIAEKVFGFEPASLAGSQSDAKKGGIDAFQTAHPERQYKKEIISGTAVFTGDTFAAISKGDLLRRRSKLNDGVVSLAAVDVDGREGEEIFIASEESLKVFQYERGILKQLSEYQYPEETKVHAMNIADIDKDGMVDICISATQSGLFSSFILNLSVDGSFIEKHKNIRWAIRPIDSPEEGIILIGQGQSNEVESFFEPGIYRLNIDGETNAISTGRKLFLPARLNLFDFVYGDIDGDGSTEKIAITSNLKLAIYDKENRLTWVSEEDYGGSVKYLGERWRPESGDSTKTTTADDESYVELQYVPPRLIAKDVNYDGRVDIISAKNSLSTLSVLNNFRSFSGGTVACLSWNGVKMTEIWQTDTHDGYISDIEFIMDSGVLNTPQGETESSKEKKVKLIVGQVPSGGFTEILNLLGDDANLFVYEFKILEKTPEQSGKTQ